MTVILKSDYIVPEPHSLDLRGIQTDLYNAILGGHKALIDPMQSGLASIAAAGPVPNIVQGGAAATSNHTFAAIADNKGLIFAGSNKSIDLPEAEWNLLNLGSEPSVVISLWITRTAVAGASTLIAGHTYQGTSYAQWNLTESPSGALIMRANGGAITVGSADAVGEPLLLTLYCQRTGAGGFTALGYAGNAKMGALARSYPFVNPLTGNASNPGPILGNGSATGYSATFSGVIHRAQSIKVNPEAFDIDEWLAAEIAGNAGRFD